MNRLETLAIAVVRIRPWNGFIRAHMIRHEWTAQPDYRKERP